MTIVLLCFGIALTLGNSLGGWLGDWKLMPTVVGCFVVELAILCVIPVVAQHYWPMLAALLLWGLAVFTLGPPLQVQVMLGAADAPNLASTINQGAFNLGNALGAWSGAAFIAGGGAMIGTAWLGAGFAALALTPSIYLLRAGKRLTETRPHH